MSVDVSYQGVVLARHAEVKETPAGRFVALEQPMPVGTILVLDDQGAHIEVRVQRVHEGVGPGVLVTAPGGTLPKADRVVAPESVPQPTARAAQEAVPEPILEGRAQRTTQWVPDAVSQRVTEPMAAPPEHPPATVPPPMPEDANVRRGDGGPLRDDGRRTIAMDVMTPERLAELARAQGIPAAPAEDPRERATVQMGAVTADGEAADGDEEAEGDTDRPPPPDGAPAEGRSGKRRRKRR
jgi:hypothetical protein